MKYIDLRLNPKLKDATFWDHGFIKHELLRGFEESSLEEADVIVFPARSQVGYADELAKVCKGKVVILTGDEEHSFPLEKLDTIVWVQNPKYKLDDKYRKLGTGYPLHFPENKPPLPKKKLGWFFSGQITHHSRRLMSQQLEDFEDGELITTDGFTKGITPKEYYLKLAQAKVAPAPCGPETPDSFRLFEALELGCVPIADNPEFWQWFFGEEPPFPIVQGYSQLRGYILDTIENYPELNNRVQVWYKIYKRKLRHQLIEDIS